MNILKKHAAQHGYNYQNLLKDFMDAPEEEQVSFLRQIGGGEDEIMQIVNAYAQATQTAPEEIISALQQLDETQLQQAIQQMAEELQGGQMQTGGIPVTKKGYYELDPNENPFAKIPSGDITMKDIPFEIDAFDGDSGEFLTRMQPEADYQFNAKSVIEKPVLQQGGPGPVEYTRLVNSPEYNEYLSLKANKNIGYAANPRLAVLEKIYESKEFLKAQKNINKFTKSDLKELQQGIEEKSASKIKNLEPLEKSNYGNKYQIKDTEHYNKILEAKKTQAIKRGIAATTETHAAKPIVPKSSFNLKGITEEGMNILSNGSKAVLEKLKALKFSKPNISLAGIKEAIPEINFSGLKSVGSKVLNGAGLAMLAYQVYEGVEGATHLNDPNYILTDDPLEPIKLRAEYEREVNPSKSPTPKKNNVTSNQDINIKGKDKTYNLKLDRNYKNTSLFNDQFGNRWRKDNKGYTIIHSPEPSKSQFSNQEKSPGITSKIKNVKQLDPVNEPDPESLAIVKDIEAGVRASRSPIKNDFLNLGDNQLPISKDMNTRLANRMATELAPKEESESSESSDAKTFTHKPDNFLRNMLLGNQVAKAFQPTAPVFRRHVEMNTPELPELDMTGYIDEIQNQFQLAQRNINPNSATGMSVLSNMFSSSLDSIRKVVNDVAGKNQQIKATNIGTRLNTINQEQKINQDYDYEAYNTHLQDLAARDALKTTAFNSLMKAKAQDNQDTALLDIIPALYPYIEEISPTVKDKIFQQRKFKLNNKNFNLPQI